MDDLNLDELRESLSDFAKPQKAGGRSPREQRILAGFEEIERFIEQNGRAPNHGEDRDIFERLYAVRLDQIRRSPECRELLNDMDKHGLLAATPTGAEGAVDEPSDDELLASLAEGVGATSDVTQLIHVRTQADRKAAEDVAQRSPCADFVQFRPLFEQVQRELDAGTRHTERFSHDGNLAPGDLFILSGQKVLVASAAEVMEKEYGREDRRLRVVFDNGTESNLWLRSLQRALYKDDRNRRILPPDNEAAPLFAGTIDTGDLTSGTIYVLESKSDHPFVAQHRSLIHKIGVTGGDVKARIANAKKDPTYLLADVDVVATFKLANISRKVLEALLHKFFAASRLDLELTDRFGAQVEPREWYLVPVSAIDDAIEKLKAGTIGNYRYDTRTASIVPV